MSQLGCAGSGIAGCVANRGWLDACAAQCMRGLHCSSWVAACAGGAGGTRVHRPYDILDTAGIGVLYGGTRPPAAGAWRVGGGCPRCRNGVRTRLILAWCVHQSSYGNTATYKPQTTWRRKRSSWRQPRSSSSGWLPCWRRVASMLTSESILTIQCAWWQPASQRAAQGVDTSTMAPTCAYTCSQLRGA